MNKWAIFFLIASCLLLFSCREDMPSGSLGEWKVYLADGEQEATVPTLSSFESFRVGVEGKDAHEVILVTSSEPWLKLERDTLPDDGIVAVETLTNEESKRREAVLTFTSADNPQHVATLTVTQRSAADDDSNGGNARQNLFVGYGYDIYKNADNQRSVHTLEPIIDCNRLKKYTTSESYETIHDCKVSRTEMKYYTSLSLYQFSRDLTSACSDRSGEIMGSLQDCKDVMKYSGSSEKSELNYGYGTMIKTVASRVMDKGALEDMQRQNKLQYVFSDGFLNAYNLAKNKSGEQRKAAIQDLLAKYGTHVITQADLGGKITYTFSMKKSTRVDNQEEMKEEIDYTLGTLQDADRNNAYQHQVSSSKSAEGAIQIVGGSEGTRTALLMQAAGLSANSQLSADDIARWLASVRYEDNAMVQSFLDVVHFELVPVWDLVESQYRNDFLNATLEMVKRSDCQLPSEMLSTALYKIDMTRPDLVEFGTSSTSSLCKTLYLKDGTSTMPVLEVCQEYVPKIRTDKRVTIVYPIYKNRLRMMQGVFLGDEEHPAAQVAFAGAKAYVTPLTLDDGQTRIQTLYYVNGTLSVKPQGLDFIDEDQQGRYVRDDVLMLRTPSDNQVHQHPIVKIGSQIWTRDNVDHNMMFTERPSDRNATTRDLIENQMLYTRFQYDVGFWFERLNNWTYGYSPLTSIDTQPNAKWYLPSPDMLTDLYEYLGFNPKALFKGQCAGFNAQFVGYIGYVDVLNPSREFANAGNELRYNNQLCVIASRSTDSKQTPKLLILHPDYRWQQVDDSSLGTEWHRNYYPVRLCRGAYYTYHSLETLKQKEE